MIKSLDLIENIMRFIPTTCLTTNMLLAKSIYNIDGTLLLNKDTKLKDIYIEKIRMFNVNGVYVNDKLSENIEVKDVIDNEVRIHATHTIKTMFKHIDDSNNVENDFKQVSMIIENIIDNLLKNDVLMINMIDIKKLDDYTFSHSVNVAVLALIVGIKLNLNKKDLYELGLGALLHDIGKVFVPEEILNKPGKLTNEEMRVMQEHSILGYDFLKKNASLPQKALTAILEHHEKYDGKGYPYKIKGKNISLFGRIIAICDVYDALTSKRVYKTPMLSSLAMEYIMSGSDTHFDSELVQIFCSAVATFPLGTVVLTNDGRKGVVIKNKPHFIGRPVIRLTDESILDLTAPNNLNVTITQIEDL